MDIKKFLVCHAYNEDVDLAIRSVGGSEQAVAEISFVSSLKMITKVSCYHAT